MADTKISAATDIATLLGTDVFPVARPPNTTAYKATVAELQTFMQSATYLSGFLFGMGLSNDVAAASTVLDIAAGTCTDSTGVVLIKLGSAWTKSTGGAFVAGSGANGMGQGLTIAVNQWYHVFAIIAAGVADVYFDTSVSAANAPVGTTALRRIGSFRTNAGAAIIAFVQNGDRFDWSAPVLDYNATPGVTTAVSYALTVPPIVVEAMLSGHINDTTAASQALYLSSLAQADVAAGGTTSLTCQMGLTNSIGSYSGVRVMTNASRQIRGRVSGAATSLQIYTNGWIDNRGRLA
jgi:hypothetical protein